MAKCKVCRGEIKKKKGPGRPRTTHAACKGSKPVKKKGKASKKKSTTKRTKSGAVRKYKSGSVTRSRKGRSYAGVGTGWLVLYHGGRTGDTQHDKTWAVKVAKKGSGWTVVTRHGKRTGQKNETSRGVMSRSAAEAAADRLVNSKLNKGYMIAGSKRRRARGRA